MSFEKCSQIQICPADCGPTFGIPKNFIPSPESRPFGLSNKLKRFEKFQGEVCQNPICHDFKKIVVLGIFQGKVPIFFVGSKVPLGTNIW